MRLPRHNMIELLGMTRLAEVEDQDIYRLMLTPQIRAHLGPITEAGQPLVMETVQGHFPGDEVSNLNSHKLYAGSEEHVRFPYLSTLHKTQWGALVIKRDAVKVKVMCWVGDVLSGKAELIYVISLRDRRFDGSKRANDCALLSFAYDDPKLHRRLHPDLRSAEISIYTATPGSRMLDATGEPEFAAFIEQPFDFADKPDLFLQYFNRAWKTRRAPGQFAAPIQDVSKLVLPGLERIAKGHGYDMLECCTSHYHVTWWFQHNGYRYSYNHDRNTMTSLIAGIQRLKDTGVKLTRTQESWLCVIQNLKPADRIPESLNLNGPIWPQTNIGPEALWMHKPLTERALTLVPGPQEF